MQATLGAVREGASNRTTCAKNGHAKNILDTLLYSFVLQFRKKMGFAMQFENDHALGRLRSLPLVSSSRSITQSSFNPNPSGGFPLFVLPFRFFEFP